MEDQKEIYRRNLNLLKWDKINEIYPNQTKVATDITSHLAFRTVLNVLVVAQCQSGKTGAMISLVENYMSTFPIPLENVYILTGLSSVDWKTQTKMRFPDIMQQRIFHRSNLLTDFKKDIEEKRASGKDKNLLFIIDEIQIAAKQEQTIDEMFKQIGFRDKANLYEKDIKIVEFSATPDGTLYDLMKWGDASKMVMMQPGLGYVGFKSLHVNRRFYQYEDIRKRENVQELKDVIEKNYGENIPLYHIIRSFVKKSDHDKVKGNFFSVFGNEECRIHHFDEQTKRHTKKQDINQILSTPPTQPTFIFIKEMLRCAKTIDCSHTGVLYDRYTKNPDDSVSTQGLAGRACGYKNHRMLVFTNFESIQRYIRLWDTEFKDEDTDWKSNTTRRVEGKTTSVRTSYGFGAEDGADYEMETKDTVCETFDIFEEAKEFIKDKFGGRGPNQPKMNQDGFVEVVVRGKKGVYSLKQIQNEKNAGLKRNEKSFRCYPCYLNLKDVNTLKWVVHFHE